ncbi:hypothetical protein LTR82_017945 [Friedmanniomyces endolithicus]|uniref:Uncharacterized protein n=1 Tax=Friedmanniomyces endolithicus TaxID=329885 RepID=A0AAN6F4S2_9PEZI|nr:hypothetical protein LTR82_017945 [Friedmanniomyces endolithicus]
MRLWSLPPCLLLLLTLSYTRSTTAASPSGGNATSSGTDIGDYILSGLGGATTTTSTATSTESALARAQRQAQSCSAEYAAFVSSVSSYDQYDGYNTTVKTTFVYTITSSQAPATTIATSLTRLCDGYARVVGQATTVNASASLVVSAETYNYTQSTSPTRYLGPSPTCSVSPSDCDLLWSSYSSASSLLVNNTTASFPAPPSCTFAGLDPTCTACQIEAASARLLYWPVTTVPGSGNLCNKMAETITAMPTGAPRSFVTSGLTITSPTVAISFGGLARMDGCGTTVDTIIAVKPDEISSVRGYHAFFSHWQFNFADLNYICASNVSSDVPMEERNDCYQAVPADAYFQGLQEISNNYILSPAQRANLTIWPNYAPELLPPATMMPIISSLWETNHQYCIINPLGAWDPPIALQAQTSVDAPIAPTSETTTAPAVATSTSLPAAAPANLATTSPASATAGSETTSIAVSDPAASSGTSTVVSTASQDPSVASELSSAPHSQSTTSQSVPDESTTLPSSTGDGPATSETSQSVQNPAGAIASLLAGGGTAASSQDAGPPRTTGEQEASVASTQQPGGGLSTTTLVPEVSNAAGPTGVSNSLSGDPSTTTGDDTRQPGGGSSGTTVVSEAASTAADLISASDGPGSESGSNAPAPAGNSNSPSSDPSTTTDPGSNPQQPGSGPSSTTPAAEASSDVTDPAGNSVRPGTDSSTTTDPSSNQQTLVSAAGTSLDSGADPTATITGPLSADPATSASSSPSNSSQTKTTSAASNEGSCGCLLGLMAATCLVIGVLMQH